MKIVKRTALAMACAGAMTVATHTAQAANWLMLQGTEPEGAAKPVNVWGFIQVDYQKDTSKPNSTGGYVPPKLLGPDLTAQEAFNVSRARIGVRGIAHPLDDKVNYFLLAEFGNNGANYYSNTNKSSAKLTDASITLNHVPMARVRVGLFKYPGAEEGLQAIQVFDYINFTEVTNQLLLERFPNRAYTANIAPCNPETTSSCNLNGFDRPVGAFRDVGVQVFGSTMISDWDTSYAVMIGNGNGLNFSDVDGSRDLYLYVSTEKVYGGEGAFREGLKLFAWSQTGSRRFDGNNDGTREKYDRDRNGVGAKYLKKPWRFTAEYMIGEGMIFNGPDKPTWALTTSTTNPDGDDNGLKAKGKGWYVEGGYYIPNTNWELDLRYDFYARLDGRTNQLDWKTWTVGAQYHYNRKTRVTFNYAARDITAINFGEGAGPNANLDGIKNRYGVQLTAVF
jgi:hypothetical protein